MKKLISILILATLLLAACGQATAQPTADQPVQPTADQPVSEAKPLRLNVAHAWQPMKTDPSVAGDFAGETMLVNIYDTLVFPTPDGGLKPWVAEKWDTSDDGLTYTFYLRKGIKFHNTGNELTAADVKFSMDRNLAIGQGHGYLWATRVEKTEAPDDYTVRFTIKKPYALFVHTLLRLYIMDSKETVTHIQSGGEYGENGDYGTKWLVLNDAGSGPYAIKEFVLEEFLLLEKNKNWWAADEFVKNSPDEVRLIPIPAPATIKSLMANRELDLSDQWESADTLRSLDQIDGVDIVLHDQVAQMYLYMNTAKAPTDDVHFRRALAYLWDYEAGAKISWEGTKASKGPVPMSLSGFAETTTYSLNLDKAKEELAQSKYANEPGKYPVEFAYDSETPDKEKLALLLQSNAQKIGIKVDITTAPWVALSAKAAKPETTANIWAITMSADLPEAGALLFTRYHSSTVGGFFQGEWLRDPKFDSMVEDSLATMDKTERFAKYKEVQKYIMDLSPTIFAYDENAKRAYQTYLDWPVLQGTAYGWMGFNEFYAWMSVNK
ncbi:MAG: ABC transporter substrate-binding protein [Proteobacteria bacterium]|nr:ABC transporter substrate-binding protein [Pseudomonadota bacterium]